MYNEQTETYAHMHSLTHMHACAVTHISLAKNTPPPTTLCTRHTNTYCHRSIPQFEPPKTQSFLESMLDKEHTISTPTLPHSLRLCPLPTCFAPPQTPEPTHTPTPFPLQSHSVIYTSAVLSSVGPFLCLLREKRDSPVHR